MKKVKTLRMALLQIRLNGDHLIALKTRYKIKLYEVVYYLALFIGIIPLSILLWNKKAFDHKEAVIPFVWITAIATLYEYFGTEVLYINSTYWFQLYSFLEIVFLFYYFYRIFGSKYKKSLYSMLAVLLITYIISCFFWSDKSSNIPLAINACSVSLFVFIFAFLHFNSLMTEETSVWKQPNFLFTVGFSLYYSATLLLFVFCEYLDRTTSNLDEYWIINIFALLVIRILLIIGTWKMQAE